MPRGNLEVFVQTRGWKLVYALVPTRNWGLINVDGISEEQSDR